MIDRHDYMSRVTLRTNVPMRLVNNLTAERFLNKSTRHNGYYFLGRRERVPRLRRALDVEYLRTDMFSFHLCLEFSSIDKLQVVSFPSMHLLSNTNCSSEYSLWIKLRFEEVGKANLMFSVQQFYATFCNGDGACYEAAFRNANLLTLAWT